MKRRWVLWVFLAAVSAGTVLAFLKIQTCATGQDPQTYLLIAKDMTGEASPMDRNLVIPGWPLALASIMKLFGKYVVLWTNVPLFVLFVWSLQALVKEVERRFGTSAFVSTGSALLLLGGYWLNPHFLLWVFRQTPMYLTAVLGFLCLARAMRRQADGCSGAAAGWLGGAWLATAAGVLVRETGAMMIPPMGLCLLANALGWVGPLPAAGVPRRRRWFLFWLFAGICAAAGVVGVLALWSFGVSSGSTQVTYLIMLLPTMLHTPLADLPLWAMIAQIPVEFGWVGVAGLLLGIVASFRRGRREYLFFFLLPGLSFLVFDGLHMLHFRFLLTTLVFFAPLSMIGIYVAAKWLWRGGRFAVRAIFPKVKMEGELAAWGALWCAMAVWASITIRGICPLGDQVKRSDVERALAALQPWVGPERPLLVDWRTRRLADVVQYFTDWPVIVCETDADSSFLRNPPLVFVQPLNDAALCLGGHVFAPPTSLVLDDWGHLEPVPGGGRFSLGKEEYQLLQLLPWTSTRTMLPLPAPPGSPFCPVPAAVMLRLEAPKAIAGKPVRVSLGGVELADRLFPGYNLLPVPRSTLDMLDADNGCELLIEADEPIPEHFECVWLSPDSPIEMTFGYGRPTSFEGYLSEEFRTFADLRNPVREHPRWRANKSAAEFDGNGAFFLPEMPEAPEEKGGTFHAELELLCVHHDEEGTLEITMSLPEFPELGSRVVRLPHVAALQWFSFDFSPLPCQPTQVCIHTVHEANVPGHILPNPRWANIQLEKCSMGYRRPVDSFSVSLAGAWDNLLLGKGFYGFGGEHGPRNGRWTDGQGEIILPLLRAGQAYRLELDYQQRRPAKVPSTLPRLEVNGVPVEAVAGEDHLEAVIPGELLKGNDRVGILSETWRPNEHGLHDDRPLGIFLLNISVSSL